MAEVSITYLIKHDAKRSGFTPKESYSRTVIDLAVESQVGGRYQVRYILKFAMRSFQVYTDSNAGHKQTPLTCTPWTPAAHGETLGPRGR